MNNSSRNNEALIAQHLRAEGLPNAAIAGIMGNAEEESGFDPTSYNAREGAIGFFQWEGGRRTSLDRLAAAMGTTETDPNAQLAYLDQELAGPYAGVLARIRSTNDPATAAAWFDVGPGGPDSGTGFENSAGTTTGARESFAQHIFGQLQAGQIPTGGGNTGGGNTGGGQGGGGQGLTGGLPSGSWWNPLNWPGNVFSAAGDAAGSVAGGVAGGVLKVVLPFATKATFIGAGLGLVLLGLYRSSAPIRDKTESVVQDVIPAAAK